MLKQKTNAQNAQIGDAIVYYAAATFALWHIWISSPFDGIIGRSLRSIGVNDGLIANTIFHFSDKAANLTQNVIHFAGFAILAGILFPLFKKKSIDLTIVTIVAFSAIWMVIAENNVYINGLTLRSIDMLFAIILIIGAIDLTHRTTGKIIPVMIIIAMCYVSFLGPYIPNVFRFAGLSLNTVLFRSVYGDDALFGNIAFISSSTITVFMIFGAFLVQSGASDFIINLARMVAGRLRGGAAFVAVIASSLTGTISGSAVANTASTGVITIPLMKKCGFRPQFAAAVEASASIGGQLMPPIMGAGAFVMAANSGIPYATIALASIIPAILYFASLAMVIRIEALKQNLPLAPPEPMPKDQFISGGLCFFAPLALLMVLLMRGYTPSYAASLAILLLIAISWLTPNPMRLKNIISALYLGAKNACVTAILLVAVGLIINVVATTGLGNAFSLMVEAWSQGNLWIALILVAIASLILGMGLPTAAAYIILSILAAPALAGIIYNREIASVLMEVPITEEIRAIILLAQPKWDQVLQAPMNIIVAQDIVNSLPSEIAFALRGILLSDSQVLYGLLAAHLVIFWLSQDSNVTPPVCLAAFTAAGIANSSPMRTGVEAWKCAKGLYIITALIAFSPIIGGDWGLSVYTGIFALFGIYGLVGLFKNYCEGELRMWHYPFLIGATGLCFLPEQFVLNLIGSVGVVVVVVLTRMLYNLDRLVKEHG